MKPGNSSRDTGFKLIVDLAKIDPQALSRIRCSYKHHPENRGFDAVLERIRFALICRRCTSAPCVAACPRGALEKIPSGTNDAGILKRANMLCTGCGTCALACPFGTIYDDLMPFASSVCDLCQDRLEPEEKPLCVRTCEDGSLDWGPQRGKDALGGPFAKAPPGDGLTEVAESILVKGADGHTWKPFLRSKQEARK
jgi:Fe-S-cluster-containing dehydrogenase component